MATSTIVTVRMDTALLAALRAAVRRDGTTVSGAIVEMVRARVSPKPRRVATRTMGMFAGQFEALDQVEFKRARREISARIIGAVRKSRR